MRLEGKVGVQILQASFRGLGGKGDKKKASHNGTIFVPYSILN
jgi:hypothetical protein